MTAEIKILLVEDSVPTRRLEIIILNKLGFQNIVEAEDGDDAIDKLLEHPDIDLIISDWNMPVKDGYEFLKWLKTTQSYNQIPFIMATAQGDRQQIRQAVQAGVTGFIAKPFDVDELKDKIDMAMGIKPETKVSKENNIKKISSGKVQLKIAHIQITDHLILGMLCHLIDTGELVPESFELETICMSGWNLVEQALEQGTVDGACVLAPIAMDLFAYGVPIHLILLAHKNGSIFVRNKQGDYSQSFKDFFNKKAFLIPHKMSIHHMLSHMFFAKMGLKSGMAGQEDIDVNYEVVAPVMMPNFLQNNIDVSGFMVAEPIGTKAISGNIADLQFFSKDVWEDHPCCVVAMSDDFITKYEKAAYEFTKMLVYAGKKIDQDPDTAAQVGVSFLDPDKKIGITSLQLKDVIIKNVKTDNLFPVVSELDRIQQYMFNKMGIGKLIDLKKFVDTRFAEAGYKDEKLISEKEFVCSDIKAYESETEIADNHEQGDHSDTLRINVDILDKLMDSVSELVLIRNQELITADYSDPAARSIAQSLDIVTTEIQETILQTRMQPLGSIFNKFPRIVREFAKKFNKKIQIHIKGRDVNLDKSILESLVQPLNAVISNCCEHGIELPDNRKAFGKSDTGYIEIHAYKEGGHVNILIKDDGRGIDFENIKNIAVRNGIKTENELAEMSKKEILFLVFLPHFSTTANVVSGRGTGLDMVKHEIEKLNGSVSIESLPEKGTIIHFRLPLTLAIIPCLIVMAGKYRYAVPQINLEELVCLYDDDVFTKIKKAGDQNVYRLRDQLLPVVNLRDILGNNLDKDQNYQSLTFAVVKAGTRHLGLIVDKVIGTEEIVVKSMHPAVADLDIYSGATIMGDGSVALILDIEGIVQNFDVKFNIDDKKILQAPKDNIEDTCEVILFKIGKTEQFAIGLSLISRVEQILVSNIEFVGNKEFITISGISTRIIHIDEFLNVSPCIKKQEMLLIIPKNISKPVGFLISEIIDTAQTKAKLNTDSYMEDGLMGTALVKNHMTLFPDIFRLIEIIDF